MLTRGSVRLLSLALVAGLPAGAADEARVEQLEKEVSDLKVAAATGRELAADTMRSVHEQRSASAAIAGAAESVRERLEEMARAVRQLATEGERIHAAFRTVRDAAGAGSARGAELGGVVDDLAARSLDRELSRFRT